MRFPVTLTREQFYEEVWSQPMAQLAKEYGVSDVALAKVCRKHDIPRPGRGYWAKKEAGKPVRKTPLKVVAGQQMIVLYVHRKEDLPFDEEHRHQATEHTEFFKRSENTIRVAEVLDSPHPVVKRAEKSLRNAKSNEQGHLAPRTAKCLDLRVSSSCLDRALHIMDALINALEERGFAVALPEAGEERTRVTILGETMGIRLEERVDQHEKPLTPAQEREKAKKPWKYPYPEWIYTPNGQLALRILGDSYMWDGQRRVWSDGKRGLLDEYLNRFVLALIDGAVYLRSKRLERERREREWEERRRREAELVRLREEEQARVKRLDAEMAAWQKVRLVREYADALETARSEVEEGTQSTEQWIAWMRDYANRLDPLRRLVSTSSDSSQPPSPEV